MYNYNYYVFIFYKIHSTKLKYNFCFFYTYDYRLYNFTHIPNVSNNTFHLSYNYLLL